MSHHEHRAHAPVHMTFAVLTVSDTRTLETDGTGRSLAEALEAAGHTVAGRRVVPDEAKGIAAGASAWLLDDRVQIVIVNGGTGISPRDVTPEAVRPLLDKELPGFGEAFRALSFQDIGSAAMLSRALAGTASGKVLFCLPGSTGGAILALDKLILPEAGHLWRMLHPEAGEDSGPTAP